MEDRLVSCGEIVPEEQHVCRENERTKGLP